MRYFLNLNTTCNQNCLFCVSAEERSTSCRTDEALVLIASALESGASIICLSGGEPTLRNDLPFLIRHLKQSHPLVRVHLLTNGVRLSDALYAKSLRGVDRVFISLHGTTARINDRLTRLPGSFKKTIKGARNIQEYGFAFCFYYVITSINYRYLARFVKLIAVNFPRCDGIMFAYPFFAGNFRKYPHLLPAFSKLSPYLAAASQQCKSYRIKWGLSSCGLMPYCVLEEGIRKKVVNDNMLFNMHLIRTRGLGGEQKYLPTDPVFMKDNFLHPDFCKKCRYLKECPGILKAYIQLYGINEFSPILRKPKPITH